MPNKFCSNNASNLFWEFVAKVAKKNEFTIFDRKINCTSTSWAI